MIRSTFSRIGKAMLLSTLIIFALGTLASAAEFSARMMIRDPNGNSAETVYVKGNLIRRDITSPDGKQIVISRPDKQATWVLNSAKKSYIVMLGTSGTNPNKEWAKISRYSHTIKHVGTDTIKGYLCDKYHVSQESQPSGANSGPMHTEVTVWVARKLNLEVKMVQTLTGGTFGSKGVKTSMDLISVKQGKQPASLFEIPAGYKKISAPAGGPRN